MVNQLTLDYIFALPNEVTLITGNPAGTLTISGGNCETLSYQVLLNADLPRGSILPFELDYTSLGACASYGFDILADSLPDPTFTFRQSCGTINFSTNNDTLSITRWDFGNGQTSTQAQPTHIYTQRGDFLVTHTVTNDCGTTSSTQTITITDPAPPDPAFMYSTEECSTLVNFFSTAMNGEIHEWDFDGDISTIESTEANPAFDFQQAGTYTVTHIITNSCSLSSSMEVITIEECTNEPCNCPNIINAGRGLALSATDLPPDQLDITDTCLAISGTLVVDVPNYRIRGGDIQMQRGSKIIVNPLMNLELSGVHLRGCGRMWQGIEVKDWGSLRMQNSMIEDAHWAIQAQRRSSLNVGKSVFLNNYVGIYTAPTGGLGQFMNARVAQSSFMGTKPLLPGYFGQPARRSTHSWAGAELNNTFSFVLGGSSERAQANHFSGLHYGIYVKNCFGGLIQRAQMSGLIEASTGVYMDNSTMIVVDDAQMDGLNYGVRGYRSSPIVRNCTMSTEREGVLLQAGQGRSAEIIKSNIQSPRGCIFITDYSGGSERVEISECSLFKRNGLVAGAAIFINNCTARLIIRDNPSIAFSPQGFGIRLSNSVGPITIEDNPLIYSTGDDFANIGIWLTNVSGAQVYNNRVNNSGNYAIAAFDAPGNLYCCNTVNGARDGVFFGGGCAGTQLKSTAFGEHQYGLNLFSTLISPQAFHGNDWTGANCEVLDAVFSKSTNFPFEVFDSRFLTNVGYVPRGHDFIGVFGGGAPEEWFVFEPDFDPHCSFYCNEPPHLSPPHDPACSYPGFDEGLTKIDHWAASSFSTSDAIKEGIHNREQHRLVHKLDCKPDLLGQDDNINQFYQTTQYSNLGLYHYQRQAIQNLFSFTATEIIQQLRAERFSLHSQIEELDSIILTEQEEPLIQRLSTVMDSIYQLEGEAWQQSIYKAEQLAIDNKVLNKSEIFEANEKAINKIVLNTTAKGIYEFNEAQKLMIDTIAAQCPLSDGIAVHMARGLQAHYESRFYDDQSICQSINDRKYRVQQHKDEEVKINVYPNPANRILNIQISGAALQPLLIEIWTAEGKAWQQLEIMANTQISVKNWPSGMYLIRIQDQGKTVLYLEKIIIAN